MKMLLTQSYTTTTTNPILLPNHIFITPKKPTSSRRVYPTFFSNLPQFSVTCIHSELVQPKPRPFPSPPPQRPRSPPSRVEELPPRVYVGHSVFKWEAALIVSPRPPAFTSLDSGAFKISKDGCLLLKFAPSTSPRQDDLTPRQDDWTPRQYDWTKTLLFSLSVGEIGRLMNLGAKESCVFFHKPYLEQSEDVQVRKVLKVEPLHDGSGHMFNLNVQNLPKNINDNICITVTKAEFTVFNSLFDFILPCLLGWNAFGSSIKPKVKIASPGKEDYE